jgi:hypothetical protein
MQRDVCVDAFVHTVHHLCFSASALAAVSIRKMLLRSASISEFRMRLVSCEPQQDRMVGTMAVA